MKGCEREGAAMCPALQKPWGRAMALAESQLPPGSPLTRVGGQHMGWKNTAKTSTRPLPSSAPPPELERRKVPVTNH